MFSMSRLRASLPRTPSRRKLNMLFLIEQWESVRDFIAAGGNVLYVVAIALFLMWAFMIERFWYLASVYPKLRDEIISNWDAREDTT